MDNELYRLFETRVGIYNLLRHFFYYGPQEDNVRELSSIIANTPDANKFSKEISVENLGKLREEYTRLFIGPGKVPVSLYETAFRLPEALLMQDTTVKLRNQYLESGMVADGIVNLPEDHLAIELEYIYSLAQEALQLLECNETRDFLQNLEKQREFIQGRIDWIETIVSKTEEYSQSLGINAVLHVLKNFVLEDLSFISSIIEENPVK